MKLDRSTLTQLPVAVPTYDRSEIGIGIVHFGVGGFHRAHQAMYIDQLLERGLAQDWGICGVGVMPADLRMRDALDAQDGLYTLILKNPDGTRDVRVIGSILEYRYAPDDPEAVIELLAAPTTRIVSLTITEGGYQIENAGDLSVFGLVTEALSRRRAIERQIARSNDRALRRQGLEARQTRIRYRRHADTNRRVLVRLQAWGSPPQPQR